MFFLILACSTPSQDTALTSFCGDAHQTLSVVITAMDFGRRDDNGAALGFNLDGHNTEFGDNEGCGLQDILSPTGEEGIDNAFSGLLPALESTQAVAINGLIEDSLRNGELIIMIELTHIDDAQNDGCADFGIWRGEGQPMIGTDGSVLDGQSFVRSTLEPGLVENISIQEGRFIAEGFNYTLPVQVLDVFVSFTMQQTRLYGEILPDGSMQGYFGGGVALEDFKTITELNDIGNVGTLLDTLLEQAADIDLDGDGECDAVSLVFTFSGVPAYFIE